MIKNVAYLVTGTIGDVELSRKWYGAKGQHIICFNYPSNIYRPLPPAGSNREGRISVLVGNSADPSNNHFDIFNRLENVANRRCDIYCPVSYGDENYANEVCREGVKIFGDNFNPIKEFMSLDEYLKLLSFIDIAIFDHPRQQAFGNTLSLLGFGKKVYINSSSTLNNVFKEYSITVYDSRNIELCKISKDVKIKNQLMVKEYFSKKSLIESLRKWLA